MRILEKTAKRKERNTTLRVVVATKRKQPPPIVSFPSGYAIRLFSVRLFSILQNCALFVLSFYSFPFW